MNLRIPLKRIIKQQRKRTREEEKNRGNIKNSQKKINKIAVSTLPVNNYFKCKWTTFSNQKI